MPTQHRRRAITETPSVRAALKKLQGELGEERIELGELVILGADAKLAALQAERQVGSKLRRRLAERIRSKDLPVSIEAADEVRASGWTRA